MPPLEGAVSWRSRRRTPLHPAKAACTATCAETRHLRHNLRFRPQARPPPSLADGLRAPAAGDH
eukprot:14446611-Alexandrium_andersonii.AAC.1